MTELRTRRATILAVGTELTEGQIINRNAAWLSAQLSKLGFEVIAHVTVADERTHIVQALQASARESALLFVSGGLGPTTDDFTRDMVAEWAGLPLVLNETVWERIQSKLSSRGVPALAAHRSQALFPQTATVLENAVGTADGFHLKTTTKYGEAQLWALPGPPKEVESIWTQNILTMLQDMIPPMERMRLFTWSCIGKGESEIAEIVEPVLAQSGLRIGYRLNTPYVEVKVWVRENQLTSAQVWLTQLEAALAPWLVVRGDEDLAASFLQACPAQLTVIDAATEGLLGERLSPLLRQDQVSSSQLNIFTRHRGSITEPLLWVKDQLDQAQDGTLAVAGFSESGQWAAGLKMNRCVRTHEWPPVVRRNGWNERGRRVVCELVLQYWAEELKK